MTKPTILTLGASEPTPGMTLAEALRLYERSRDQLEAAQRATREARRTHRDALQALERAAQAHANGTKGG